MINVYSHSKIIPILKYVPLLPSNFSKEKTFLNKKNIKNCLLLGTSEAKLGCSIVADLRLSHRGRSIFFLLIFNWNTLQVAPGRWQHYLTLRTGIIMVLVLPVYQSPDDFSSSKKMHYFKYFTTDNGPRKRIATFD